MFSLKGNGYEKETTNEQAGTTLAQDLSKASASPRPIPFAEHGSL
jgi:hypothetical protein